MRVVAALLALLVACSSGADGALGDVVLTDAATGFELVSGPSGVMDREAAVTATIADEGEKSRFLGRSGYLEGYSRVWTKDSDHVSVLVYDFTGASGAKALVAFETKQLGRTSGYEPFKVKQIAGARGYILSATRRSSSDPLFCQGVWFPVDTKAFAVNTCGEQPNTTTLAVRLAIAQWKRAR